MLKNIILLYYREINKTKIINKNNLNCKKIIYFIKCKETILNWTFTSKFSNYKILMIYWIIYWEFNQMYYQKSMILMKAIIIIKILVMNNHNT